MKKIIFVLIILFCFYKLQAQIDTMFNDFYKYEKYYQKTEIYLTKQINDYKFEGINSLDNIFTPRDDFWAVVYHHQYKLTTIIPTISNDLIDSIIAKYRYEFELSREDANGDWIYGSGIIEKSEIAKKEVRSLINNINNNFKLLAGTLFIVDTVKNDAIYLRAKKTNEIFKINKWIDNIPLPPSFTFGRRYIENLNKFLIPLIKQEPIKIKYLNKEYINNNLEILKCIEIVINDNITNNIINDDEFFSLKIENQNTKEIFSVPISWTKRNFTLDENNKYLKKFGKKNWVMILNGTVKRGWSEEMCRMSWGDPVHINETINRFGKSEQWVYENNNYLYFTNNKLKSIQK